jgi:hypothetical protein
MQVAVIYLLGLSGLLRSTPILTWRGAIDGAYDGVERSMYPPKRGLYRDVSSQEGVVQGFGGRLMQCGLVRTYCHDMVKVVRCVAARQLGGERLNPGDV